MFGPRPRTVFGLVDVPGRPTPRLILVKPSNEGLLLGPHLSLPIPLPSQELNSLPLIFALVFRFPHWSLTEFPGPIFVLPWPSSPFPPKEAPDSWKQLAFNCSKLKQLNKGGNVC